MVALSSILVAVLLAQNAQNPSPMVEHRRVHSRLKESKPPGRREPLSFGNLFVPSSVKIRKGLPLLMFFHGGSWVPEVAASQRKLAVISIQIGAGSGIYVRAFQDPERFLTLIHEAEKVLGVQFGKIMIGGWSAGCGALRAIVREEANLQRIDSVIAIDGIHTDYVEGKPGPQDSHLTDDNLQMWLKLGHAAVSGRKQLLITNSEIFPGTYASTTETTDWLVKQLDLRWKPVLRWGPLGSQQVSEVKAGRLEMRGYAGNTAPDHVDQLHSLPEYLKWVRR